MTVALHTCLTPDLLATDLCLQCAVAGGLLALASQLQPGNLPLGMRRYHPHYHGATALQGQTATGPITIDSDIQFLTPPRGCGPLSSLLESIQTRILYLQTMFFRDADVHNNPS